MENIFCCSNLIPYRPHILDHESKFTVFMSWAKSSAVEATLGPLRINHIFNYAIQLVKQINYGPLESKRYFVPGNGPEGKFAEITEKDLLSVNFEKVNSYKNFVCRVHNKFFELNLYQKDPVNAHHWRANIARPADQIDVSAKVTKVTKPNQQPRNPNSESGGTRFGGDLIFGILSLVLPSLVDDFNGDMLSLVVLDLHSSKVHAPINLAHAWETLFTPGNIVDFIIDCGYGYDMIASRWSEAPATAVESMVGTSFAGKPCRPCLASLRGVLQNIIKGLAPTLGEGSETRDLCEIVQRALEIADQGPSPDFRIDLYRNGKISLSTRQTANKEREQTLALDSGPTPLLNGADTTVHLGASDGSEIDVGPSDDSDGDERWRLWRNHKDYGYGDDGDGGESPRDLTACDKECGYCGHCDY